MNTLYLRVPPKHTASWPNGALAYAVGSAEGLIIREGQASLTDLAPSIARSNVVLLIAAADVTLLELTTPPMPEQKLKQALPNLIEDQLMSDAADSVLILGAKAQDNPNKRMVAVAQRAWLQQLSASLFALGAGHVKALPAQLCLPIKKDQCSAGFEQHTACSMLVLRLGEESGIGMMQAADLPPEDCLATIAMLATPGPVMLQLPAQQIKAYQAAVKTNPDWEQRFTLHEVKWSSTVAAAKTVGMNLMAGVNSAQTSRIQWRIWRWPLVLAVLVALVNIVALNYDYWSQKREAQALRNAMIQTYRTTFPKETVIASPLEQMRQKLDAAQRGSGQGSPDDFTLLLTQFSEAWNAVGADKLPKLVSIEYKERALLLQVKGTLPQKELQLELDAKGLTLKKNSAEVWQIRTAK